MASKKGPWGPRKPPYHPSQDGFGADGYRAWDFRTTVLVVVVAGTALAILSRL